MIPHRPGLALRVYEWLRCRMVGHEWYPLWRAEVYCVGCGRFRRVT